MKDKHDQSTADPFLKVRRGRPRDPNALTAAERKRAQRERDKAVIAESADFNLKLLTLSGLLEYVAHCVSTQQTSQIKAACNELIRRSKS